MIATHSPSIVADLNEERSFILNMDDNNILNAKKYVNRSSDYQLATLFKVPGFRNEYLNREAVNILTTLSKYGVETSSDIIEHAKSLIQLMPKLNENDPIKELILIIKESLEKMKK